MGIKGNPYLGSEGTEIIGGSPATNKFYAVKAVGGDITLTAESENGADWGGVTISSGDTVFDLFKAGATATGAGEARGYIRSEIPAT